MRGRLVTGSVRPLQRTLTLAGGWGITGPEVGPTFADEVVPASEDKAFDPPRTSFFELGSPLDPPRRPRFGPLLPQVPVAPVAARSFVWKEMLVSRTAIAACLVGAFVAGLLVFRAGSGARTEAPPAARTAASRPAPTPGAAPEPVPAVAAAPAPEEPAPPAVAAPAPVVHRATAPLPRAARARPPVTPPRPARKPAAPASKREWVDPFSNGSWVDPFSDGSWVDLPSKEQ